ncbi:MAG: hypothetical protein PVJ49_19085 [Acidobacteriota bacterium]
MSPDPQVPHKERLAPRALTLMYLGYAYLCLGLACTALIFLPRTVGGFFYQPKMLAVVHLVTLGWISASILGYFHLVGPIALRTVMRPGWRDYLAYALVVIGISGLVSHFWIDEYSGMVWSAGTLVLGLAFVAARAIRTVLGAKIQPGVRLHLVLAFLNLLGAGVLGMLIGLEKQQVHVLPGYLLHTVYAHAHLAALGWATMMVMGVGYRLFPMVLPSAMPPPQRTWASAVLVEGGLLLLLLALPASSAAGIRIATLALLGGLAWFFLQVVWMKRHPKPTPKDLQRPDLGTLHAMQGIAYLVLAAAIGTALAFAPFGAWKIRAAVVYGVFALLGFLAQMVIGIAARILPMFSWTHYFVGSDFKDIPPSQYTMHSRALQAAGLLLWTVGVPALAWGLSFDRWSLVSVAAGALLIALLCNGVNTVLIARHAFRWSSAGAAEG